jgi:RNA polymerase sigma-70 factor (ECF subfamily)
MELSAATTTTTAARQAFGELLERHRGLVLKVAGSYAADPEDRADLA